MAEYIPSKQIRTQIATVTNKLKSNESKLKTISKPIDSLKLLETQITDKENQIKKETNETVIKRLSAELKILQIRYDDLKKSITSDLEKEISVLRGLIDENNKEIEQLNSLLIDSLEYEKLLSIRNSTTIVDAIDISSVIGSIRQLVINKGQKCETLFSTSTGNVYMKISLLESIETLNIIKKTVNYNNVTIVESDKASDVVINPKVFQGEIMKDSSPIEVRGNETVYLSQTFNYDVTLSLDTTIGFILFDSDRLDGELSVWVLTQSNNIVYPA